MTYSLEQKQRFNQYILCFFLEDVIVVEIAMVAAVGGLVLLSTIKDTK